MHGSNVSFKTSLKSSFFVKLLCVGVILERHVCGSNAKEQPVFIENDFRPMRQVIHGMQLLITLSCRM